MPSPSPGLPPQCGAALNGYFKVATRAKEIEQAHWVAEGDVPTVAFNTAVTVAGDTTGQVHALQLNVPAAASA